MRPLHHRAPTGCAATARAILGLAALALVLFAGAWACFGVDPVFP